MRTYIFKTVFLALLCSCNPKGQQKETNHKMQFANFIKTDSLNYNFGTIKDGDRNINHVLVFTNSKKETIYISKIPTLCPCLSLNYPRKKINPNETFWIKVSYTPKIKTGFFNHQIMIILNDGKYFINPTIKGIIK